MTASFTDAQQCARNGPILVVMNDRSGHGDSEALCSSVMAVLGPAGREHQFLRVEPAQLPATAARAVALAQARGGVVVAAGGDGTINTVAQAVLGSGVPFGVLPQGTFNLFGRSNGIPEDAAAAARILLDGELTPVQVGRVNDRIFLVNASLGLYPQVLEDRETDKARYGRWRLVAIVSALSTLLRTQRQLQLTIESEGASRSLRTLALFAGNNRLQLERIGIEAEHRAALDRGELVGTMLRPISVPGMLGLILRGALGRLGEADAVQSFGFRTLSVTPRRKRRIKVGVDGEVGWMRAPVQFSVAEERLWLLTPKRDVADAATAAAPALLP